MFGGTWTFPLSSHHNKRGGSHYRGTILGLHITQGGYQAHVTNRISYASLQLSKLYRFQSMPTKIKLHLIKTLIFPILDYHPISTHALSKTQLGRLQRTPNKALRFATNQCHPYTLTTIQLHDYTNTLPLNIGLHNRAIKIWDRLHSLHIQHLDTLTDNAQNITRYHRHLPAVSPP